MRDAKWDLSNKYAYRFGENSYKRGRRIIFWLRCREQHEDLERSLGRSRSARGAQDQLVEWPSRLGQRSLRSPPFPELSNVTSRKACIYIGAAAKNCDFDDDFALQVCSSWDEFAPWSGRSQVGFLALLLLGVAEKGILMVTRDVLGIPLSTWSPRTQMNNTE